MAGISITNNPASTAAEHVDMRYAGVGSFRFIIGWLIEVVCVSAASLHLSRIPPIEMLVEEEMVEL